MINGSFRPKSGRWSPLGTGLNSTCYTITSIEADTRIFAGGSFTTAGGSSANRIAQWTPSTSTWSPLGSGLNDTCRASCVHNPSSAIYVGGDFTTAGGISCNYIAVWDGSTWSPLGTGLNAVGRSITPDNIGSIYVGGDFTTAGGNTVNRVAKWDGSSWNSIGSPFTNRCITLVYDYELTGYLYAAGSFTDSGMNYIAKWDGSTWSPLGTGLNATCRSISLDSLGDLYVAGDFTTAGDLVVRYAAYWSRADQAWRSMGSGHSGILFAICPGSGEIAYYTGGLSTKSGGVTANRIAKWVLTY